MEPVSHIQKNNPAIVQDNGAHQTNELSPGRISESTENSNKKMGLAISDVSPPRDKTFSASPRKQLERKIAIAIEYAKLAPVLPLQWPINGKCSCGNPDCSSPGKHPLTKNGLLDATQDPDQIRRWFEKWPDANIGIVTGGNLVVFDRDGPVGEKTFRDLQESHGELPRTLEVITGNGDHSYYCKPVDVRIPCSAGKLGPKLDVRGEGGYIVAPPSIHVSGAVYKRKNECTNIADLPPEWLDLLSVKARIDSNEAKAPPEAIIPEGQRNPRLFREACKLVRIGWSEDMILAAISAIAQSCCENPKTLSQTEIRAIVQSAIKRNPITVVEPEILSAAEVRKRAGEKIPWTIENIIRPGCGVLGGRPSVGKSWGGLNAAISIVSGSHFLGRFAVRQSEVLILALEDSPAGLSDRLEKLGITTDGIHFAFGWPLFDDRQFGLDWLEKTLDRHPNIKFVFIDPLVRIKPQKPPSANEYDWVYQWMTPIAHVARSRDVAIVLSHHHGKTERTEAQDRLMGTTAYAAAADFKLSLERGNKPEERILQVGGRLIPQEMNAVLRLNDGCFSWLGMQTEVRKSEMDNKVLKALGQQPGGTTEIAKRLGENKSSVWNSLNRLVEDGLAERNGKLYRLSTLNS